MRIIFIVRLILMELNLNEVGVDSIWVEREGDYGIYHSGLGDEFEGP